MNTKNGAQFIPERVWQIRDWDCARQGYGPLRSITLSQFLAENETKKARALAIYRANAAKIGKEN